MCAYYIPLHAYHFQVPLGVLQHNENRIDEMTKIMDHVHTYVPSVSQCNVVTLPNEDTFEDKKDVFIVSYWEETSSLLLEHVGV